jgi:hypothetical protein
MKACCWRLLFLIFLVTHASLPAQDQSDQDPHKGFAPWMRMESRQGYPEQADVISHRHMAKDTHAKCIQVRYRPKLGDNSAACLLRYDSGDKYELKFDETMRFPKEGEVYLECLGNKPTRCAIGLW